MKILHNILIVGAMVNVVLASQISMVGGGSNNAFFMGIEGSAMRNISQIHQTLKSHYDELSRDETLINKDWSGGAGIKLGYYLNNHRFYIGYIYNAYSQAFKTTDGKQLNPFKFAIYKTINTKEAVTHKLLLGYDYVYNIANNNNFVVGLYVGYGANLGKVDASTANIGKNINQVLVSDPSNFTALTHFVLGGINLGYLYNLKFTNKYFGDIETGVRIEYLKTIESSKRILVGVGVNGSYYDTIKGYGELFSTGFYLGYSYKF